MTESDKKQVLLTFDYELFLGVSGSIDNCLIKPTHIMKDIFKTHNVRATFFVDATFLQKLLEQKLTSEYQKIERQLIGLIEDGHRIELHLHPNWYDAYYEGKEWLFKDYRYYRIGDCPENVLNSLWDNGYEILSNIASKVDSNYKLMAFRAGGWCVDPFGYIEHLFQKYNLLIDSSVLPLNSETGNISRFDYSDISSSLPYYFDKDLHEKSAQGKYLEIPISIYHLPFYREIYRGLKIETIKHFNHNISCYGDGKTITASGKQKNALFSKLEKIKTRNAYLTTDGYHFDYFFKIIKKQQPPVVTVGHPKVLNRHSADTLDKLCSMDYNFINYSDYYKKTTERQ